MKTSSVEIAQGADQKYHDIFSRHPRKMNLQRKKQSTSLFSCVYRYQLIEYGPISPYVICKSHLLVIYPVCVETTTNAHHCLVIDNPVNHFPVYEPSTERVAEIAAEYAEENNPLNLHYDASQEVRAKGAGFYQFSGDEETRKQQMEELRLAREETERTRTELGAVDLRPGEVEGMVTPDGEASEKGEGGLVKRSRAMEKRKREIEERRKALEAKRRKKDGGEEPSAQPTPSLPPPPQFTADVSQDPFAALEAQATQTQSSKSKGKAKECPPAQAVNEADAFLAALERDMLQKTYR